MMRRCPAVALAVASLTACVDAASPDAWRSRSIYQVLTDRFAAEPPVPQCADYSNYCGGNFAARPIRPEGKLAKNPPSTVRVLKKDCAA